MSGTAPEPALHRDPPATGRPPRAGPGAMLDGRRGSQKPRFHQTFHANTGYLKQKCLEQPLKRLHLIQLLQGWAVRS